MTFSKLLIQWYLQNKRDLPWRDTQNPYLIWLSEIMLQQTRVAQGMPYFLSFTAAFPTVHDLANASEFQVLKLWQGLGYYSRARNLHKTAQIISKESNGFFPDNYKSLLQLKGVGDYTAAAIASFAFDEAVPVVDGNVFRVLSRYFNLENDISLTTTKKVFQDLALEIMPKNDAATFNQAIMEFGALQCVPKNPNCNNCIFNESCMALQHNKVSLLPFKTKKVKVSKRFFNYLVFQDNNQKTIIQQRTTMGIWYNLYEFPLIETQEQLDDNKIESIIALSDFVENRIKDIKPFDLVSRVHKLTHQHLSIRFWKVTVEGSLKNGIDFGKIKKYPFPIVIFNFINTKVE